MIKRILQLFTIFVLVACNNTTTDKTIDLITDSYFFQKTVYNINLYTCDKTQENFQTNYKSTSNKTNFLNFSEIKEKDTPVEGCTLSFLEVNELTPTKKVLLDSNLYLEISSCTALSQEENIYKALSNYLEYIKTNNLNLWSGISNLNNNNFYWLNVWPNKEYREEFLQNWLSVPNAGNMAQNLSDAAFCTNPETYLFLK